VGQITRGHTARFIAFTRPKSLQIK
jgi:hypothetical protein